MSRPGGATVSSIALFVALIAPSTFVATAALAEDDTSMSVEAAAPRIEEQIVADAPEDAESNDVDDDVESLAAAVKGRGALEVYPEILASIDDGNIALRAALADSATRATASGQLLDLQRRRSALRLATFLQLPPGEQQHYEGVSAGAIAQLQREARQVALAATHLVFVGFPQLLEQWRNPGADRLTSLLIHIGALVLLIALAFFVAARGTSLWRRARVAAASIRSRTLARLGATWCGVASALWTPIVLIVAVAVVEVIVADLAHFGVIVVLFVWLRGWAWLRLVVAIVVEVIHWLAATPLGGLSAVTTQRVFSSVRLAGRAALVIVVANAISEVALGKGALYRLSAGAAWIAAGVVAIVLVRRWQDDIANRYLALRPTGALADAVRKSREHWYGFFVGLSALVIVFLQAVSSLVRRFLLGFDQTRKALAFVFRRRLEREAKSRAPDAVAQPLPESVAAALSEQPDVDDTDLVADRHAADIARLRKAVTTWQQERDRVGTALLVGLAGHGKTTWVRTALAGLRERDVAELPVTTVQLRSRLRSVAALYRTFGAAFDAETDTFEEVVTVVKAEAPRLIVIDDLHNLLLRGDPDHRVWDAFSKLVGAISDSAFILATIDSIAVRHLDWAGLGGALFRERFELRPWTEAEIEVLLTRRVDRTGYTVRYDDLVVARVDDADRDLRLLATAREYARLIWDFAEGSPAVALDAWKRSLHLHDDGELHVRLFRQPDEALLERTETDARFVLATVFWNENVTAAEAARGLSMPTEHVATHLERFREVGILVREHQRYRVTTAWWSMVLRFLRRKHFINA